MTMNSLPLPQLSLPKDKIKILLLEGVNDSAVELIESGGLFERDAALQGARWQ